MLFIIILLCNLIIINAIGKSVFSSISSCKDTTYIHRENSRFNGLPFINEEDRSSLSVNKYDKHTVIFAIKQNYDEIEKKLFDVNHIPNNCVYIQNCPCLCL